MLVTNGGNDGGGVGPARKMAAHGPPRARNAGGDLLTDDLAMAVHLPARALQNRILKNHDDGSTAEPAHN